MRRLLLLFLFLLVAVSCATGGRKAPPELVSRADRYYLVSPLEGYPLSLGSDVRLQLENAHRALVEQGDRRAVDQTVARLQERNPDLAPTRVLQAQSDFVIGLHQEVLDELAPVVGQHPEYVAAQLLYGRSSEVLGQLVQGLEAYQAIASANALAKSRALELGPGVAQEMAERIEEDLARGHIAEARTGLSSLQTWAPDSTVTFEMSARVARATGDEVAELEALRRLASRKVDDLALLQRQAELELEVGDPAAGMRLIEELAASNPQDLAIQEELAEARFLWRIQLLPAEVRTLAEQQELTRGDFAVLVYWLFPQVRYGRSSSARIANDILDHPQRDSLVRIINAGVMEVEPSLHRFDPYRPLKRHEALSAMLSLLASKRPPFACLEGAGSFSSSQGTCSASQACGLVGNVSDCLPEATVSGSAALEICRSTQELMGIE